MVEAHLDARTNFGTPTPGGYFTQQSESRRKVDSSSNSGRNSPDPGIQTVSDSMGDDSQGHPPDQARSGSSRRRSRSQQVNRSHPQPYGHGIPATSPTENFQNRHPNSFQGPSVAPPYTQRHGYNVQFAQPPPMSYGFPHTNVVQQNVHANYPPTLQPPIPVFPDVTSPSHPPFSGYPTPASPPAPSHRPPGQGFPRSPPFFGANTPFHSLIPPPPVTTPPFAYPQPFPQSPMYQPQFPSSPYGQHYTPTGELESQGTWYYLPHPTQQPYDQRQSYQNQFSPTFPQVGHMTPSETPYSAPSPSSQWPSQGVSQQPILSDSPRPSAAPADRANSMSSGSGRPNATSDRPVVRRSYHPNPPAHRSEWVMWVGNVPSDATHDELWRFFNEPPATGVLSIFLISRSSCVFVNYESEASLHEAIARFNGVPLRPQEPRCPRLVCRVRKKDDDLKAGVGGQRGMGMHTKWIQAQKGKAREQEQARSDKSTSDDPNTSPSTTSIISDQLASPMANMSLSSDEDGRHGARARHSSSSGSTNSSFLTMYFPERYFILKSLTQEDLDTSVSRGVWATQKHNEEILDQAFRTSKQVILIFGVNKSGEFYGYARMTGPVLRGEHRVSWASRSSPHPSSISSGSHSRASHPPPTFFSPGDHRLVDASPLPVDAPTSDGHIGSIVHQTGAAADPNRLHHTAPALIGHKYHLPTLVTPATKYSLDQLNRFRTPSYPESASSDGFELDPSAPLRAMRSNQGSSSDEEEKAGGSTRGSVLEAVDEEEERKNGGEPEGIEEVEEGDRKEGTTKGQDPSWGDSFAVEWISTARVPFHRTRHLRNPWNHDREVKVSRDGTELEPSVGKRLLDEWDKLSDPQAPLAVAVPKPTGGGKRGPGAKNKPSLPSPPEGPTEGGGSSRSGPPR